MRIKIIFAVFQSGSYDEDVEGEYSFEDPTHAVEAMAHFMNIESAANRNDATRQEADKLMFRPRFGNLLYPPATRQGLGANTNLVIKNIEFL